MIIQNPIDHLGLGLKNSTDVPVGDTYFELR